MIYARVLLILIACTAVAAQTPSQLDKLRADGYEALYNLDYETARRHFQKMIELAPDNPAGPQSLAASLWIQQLNESWERKATLYSDKADENSKEKIDPRRVDEFKKWTRRAKQLAQARLRRDPRDVEALYFLGAAEGLEAAYSAGVERKFMPALRAGEDAVDHHHKVLELSPNFYDAELTIGLQDYVIGSLPLPVKMLAGTFGVRGSKKRGLSELEKVARDGHWGRDVARVLLVDLYKREKRWDDAIATTRDLSARYPRNYLFKLQLADAMAWKIIVERTTKPAKPVISANERQDVFAIYDSLLRDKSLAPQTTLIQSRRNETARLLSGVAR
jgi:tetratricopeptide (TPR) repeat protein